jgi:hypothetical protein
MTALPKAEVLRVLAALRKGLSADPDGSREADLATAFAIGVGLATSVADGMAPGVGARAAAFLAAAPLERLSEYLAHVEAQYPETEPDA